ncbi:MAG: tRNA pseudouridine(38-40) synthase TruA [Candidatus Limnocylindria bacterium]
MTAEAQECARAIIGYDGTAFAGSQVQPNARTVQGELESALNTLIGERTRVRLAGRTDAGVHATGQVAAFCYARRLRREGGLPELRRRLNAALPPDLTVRTLRPAPPDFDPRREARWRVYRYRVLTNGARNPLERHRTLEIDEHLDTDLMRTAASRLLGERDFAALGADAQDRTVRHLAELRITRRGDLFEIRVTANAFLRRMVRSIVALLIEVGRGRMSPAGVERALDAGARVLHGRVVPSRGLTLERVIYASATKSKNERDAPPNLAARPSQAKPESSRT